MKTRGDIIGFGETVQLKVQFNDSNALPVDLDAMPEIQLVQPDSVQYKPYDSIAVYQISTGVYAYDFDVPLNGPAGVWVDNWHGLLSGNIVTGSFVFVVYNVDLQHNSINDGYEQLGDIPNIVLSQTAIHNINILMNILRKRLQSSGWHMVKDANGVLVRENCDIFSIEELFAFLCSSLSEFNSTPHYTDFHWEDDVVIMFRDVIVEGAYIMALASKALIEKGREFTITDSGLSFMPPLVADLLNSQFSTLLGPYREKLKQIKYSMKPSALGLGTLRITSVSPQVLRLRHRREMQFPVQ